MKDKVVQSAKALSGIEKSLVFGVFDRWKDEGGNFMCFNTLRPCG